MICRYVIYKLIVLVRFCVLVLIISTHTYYYLYSHVRSDTIVCKPINRHYSQTACYHNLVSFYYYEQLRIMLQKFTLSFAIVSVTFDQCSYCVAKVYISRAPLS